MARNLYLAEADLTAGLPTGHGMSTATLTDIRTKASDWIDAQFGVNYWVPFADIAATPSTPAPVHELAMLYAQWYGRWKLAPAHRNVADTDLTAMRLHIDTEVAKYQGDAPKAKLGPVQVSAEAITWGVGDYDDWALLSSGNKDVDGESASMTSADGATVYLAYTDFRIGYSHEYRSYYVQRMSSETPDGVLLTYWYSLIRRRETDTARPPEGRVYLS